MTDLKASNPFDVAKKLAYIVRVVADQPTVEKWINDILADGQTAYVFARPTCLEVFFDDAQRAADFAHAFQGVQIEAPFGEPSKKK